MTGECGPGIVVAMVSEAKTLTKASWVPGELIRLPEEGSSTLQA